MAVVGVVESACGVVVGITDDVGTVGDDVDTLSDDVGTVSDDAGTVGDDVGTVANDADVVVTDELEDLGIEFVCDDCAVVAGDTVVPAECVVDPPVGDSGVDDSDESDVGGNDWTVVDG